MEKMGNVLQGGEGGKKQAEDRDECGVMSRQWAKDQDAGSDDQ
jgi:hypothetical protein